MLLQTLYEQDFRLEVEDTSFSLSDVLARNIERYDETIDDKDFIEQLVKGVDARRGEIDAILRPVAPEWPVGTNGPYGPCNIAHWGV